VIREYQRIICDLAKISQLTIDPKMAKPELAAAAVTDGLELFVPLRGLIDLDKERERLQKEIGNLEGLLAKLEVKLFNADFVSRAPAHILETEKSKQSDYTQRLSQLRKNLSQISN